MKYEIRRLYGDQEVLEVAATLDHARLRGIKLAVEEGWTIILANENGRRTVRSFAGLGKAFWPTKCTTCKGTGRGSYNVVCGDCQGHGGTMDINSGEAA